MPGVQARYRERDTERESECRYGENEKHATRCQRVTQRDDGVTICGLWRGTQPAEMDEAARSTYFRSVELVPAASEEPIDFQLFDEDAGSYTYKVPPTMACDV